MEFSKLMDRAPPRHSPAQSFRPLVQAPRDGGFQKFFRDFKDLRVERLAYEAARPSRLRRVRGELGGTADAHYAWSLDYWRVREYARDMDRNDTIVGQMVDRAIENMVGGQISVQPITGDSVRDAEGGAAFHEWADNPRLFDAEGVNTFSGMLGLAQRGKIVDGDSFLIFGPQGRAQSVRLLEGDRIDGGLYDGHVVHGVERDPVTQQRVRYYVVPDKLIRTKVQRIATTFPIGALTAIDAYDERGVRQVAHLHDQKRASMTRGMSAFKSVFDTLTMFEDVNYAKLVQQQVVSCIAAFITSAQDTKFGPREQQQLASTQVTLQKLSPGIVPRLPPGADVKGFSPQVPNSEFLGHVRLIVRLIGVQIGMPLELVLLDTTDTTFHGYRGVVEQAKIGWRAQRNDLKNQAVQPIYDFFRTYVRPDLGLPAAFRVKFPGWAYVDPEKDAKADRERLRTATTSPRRVSAERLGESFEVVAREIVEDYATLIRFSAEKAQEFSAAFPGQTFTWRDFANLDAPEGAKELAALARQVTGDGGE